MANFSTQEQVLFQCTALHVSKFQHTGAGPISVYSIIFQHTVLVLCTAFCSANNAAHCIGPDLSVLEIFQSHRSRLFQCTAVSKFQHTGAGPISVYSIIFQHTVAGPVCTGII